MALINVNLIDLNDHGSCNEGQEELPLDEPADDDPDLHELVGNEPYLPEDLPKRVRKPPRRLIEEV